MLTSRWISNSDFRMMARSHKEFLEANGLTAAVGAILPEEFLAELLTESKAEPEWPGVLAIREERVLGSGGFKGEPIDGWIEIGYGVAPEIEGQGVATFIAGTMCDFARSKGLVKVRAHTLPDGFASQRVVQKNGFEFVGIFEDPEDGTVHRFEKQLSQKH